MDEQNQKPWNRSVTCIHCDKKFWVEVQINFTPTDIEGGIHVDDWKDSLEPAKKKVLAEAEASGLLQAFTDAATAAKGDQIPRNMEKFLLTFFQTAVRKLVPSEALDFYIAEFPSREITFLGAQGILAVLADGVIKCFIPSEFAVGVTIRAGNGSGHGMRTNARLEELPIWRRTRMGYVVQGEILADELKRILVGSFAKPRIEIKGRR